MPEQRVVGSLRRRLLLISAFSTLSALVLGVAALYRADSIQDAQAIDARLEQLGATIESIVGNGLALPGSSENDAPRPLITRPSSTMLYSYQVWSASGQLLLRSHEASDRPVLPRGRPGFSNISVGADSYRIFCLPARSGGVVQVSESINDASVSVADTVTEYVALLALPLTIVFSIGWVLTRRSLRSIVDLANQLESRDPRDVSSLKIVGPVKELVPILTALDRLFARTGEAIRNERKFLSVVAHEMRTPLAGLRAQAQIAAATDDPGEARQALTLVMQGVDRSAHIFDQLLDLARLEALSSDPGQDCELIEIDEVFKAAMVDLGVRARHKSIVIGTKFDVKAIRGTRLALHLILRNLLDNAVTYCPHRGQVRATTMPQGDGVTLTIDDSGPGIAKADQQRAFRRFDRLGRVDTDGVGLGLSIVELSVQALGGSISLQDSPLGGLRVAIFFPASPSPIPSRLRLVDGASKSAFSTS